MSPFGVLFIGYNLLFLCCIEKVLQFDCISHVSYLYRTIVVPLSYIIRIKFETNTYIIRTTTNYIRIIFEIYTYLFRIIYDSGTIEVQQWYDRDKHFS